ncbi:MAG TPA: hypothetical protein DCQ98_15390 [Planctomycetaceae bacterium]|nr:hypothetical protein [Planctomycetaceae bacterium]
MPKTSARGDRRVRLRRLSALDNRRFGDRATIFTDLQFFSEVVPDSVPAPEITPRPSFVLPGPGGGTVGSRPIRVPFLPHCQAFAVGFGQRNGSFGEPSSRFPCLVRLEKYG